MTKLEGLPEQLAYSPTDAARLLGLSSRSIYNLMANGTLASLKIGKSRRITHKELERLLEHQAAA